MAVFLIVDDSAAVRFQVDSAVRKTDARARTVQAGNAQQAVAAFREHRPQVMFLDIMLGAEEFGTGVMADILADDPSVSIVIMTGLPPSDEKVVEALSNGARGYLAKPVTHDAVRTVLARIEQETAGLDRIL